MGNVIQDLRYALRSFAKSPGFAAAAVLSLALGIGANATIFSIANAVLSRRLPVKDPGSLVALYWGGQRGEGEFSYPDYLDIRDKSHMFESVAAFCPLTPFSLSAGSEPERVWGQVATGNFFQTAGVQPVLGRGFLPEEDQAPGRNPVVVLGYSLWQRSFASDANIVGKKVVLNKVTFTVVGVAPEGFRGTFMGVMPELWIPTMMQSVAIPGGDLLGLRGDHWIDVIARLKPGVTRQQAQQAMLAFAKQFPESYGKDNESTILVQSIGDVHPMMRMGVVAFVGALMVVVGLVLLIACANVANLLLARAAARQKEIAVRVALGAGRARLIQQLLTESIVLAIAGGLAGLLLADWAGTALNTFRLPLPMPINFRVAVDGAVLAYTMLLSLLTGVIFGLSPALQATRTDIQTALKDGAIALGRWRRFGLRNSLVVVQVSLSLVLLIGTGLFLRSLQNAHGVQVGFKTDHLLLFSVDPNTHGYSEPQAKQFYRDLQARLEARPQIKSATVSEMVPLSFAGSATSVASAKTPFLISDIYMTAPHYFDTLGVPLLRGRDFTGVKENGPHVAIVNEVFGERMWPGEDPVGKTFQGEGNTYEVIGLARNTKSRTLGEAPKPIFYEPIEQNYHKAGARFGTTIIIRTNVDPAGVASLARQVVRDLDPNMAVFNMETMDQHMVSALFLPRLAATLFGVFGMVGLLLASVGLYGLMNYSVSRRTHEIGIRMALGAGSGQVRGMVLRQGLALSLTGMGIGLVIALVVTRFASTLLFGINPLDAITFLGIPSILLVVALVATGVPAWRATRVDPMVALRYQ